MATSEPGRLARYAVSSKNIVGCLLALGGPVLALTGVLAPPIAIALIVPLYAAGALAVPGHRKLDLVAGMSDGMDAAAVRKRLDTLQGQLKGRVPAPVTAKVAHIADVINSTLPRASSIGGGSEDLHAVVKTATDYLPATLQTYLDLPRAYAERRIVAPGKTSLDVLCDQLDVISTKMDEILDAVTRSDTDKLIANGRFLSDKFGGGGNSLDLGPDQGPHP